MKTTMIFVFNCFSEGGINVEQICSCDQVARKDLVREMYQAYQVCIGGAGLICDA